MLGNRLFRIADMFRPVSALFVWAVLASLAHAGPTPTPQALIDIKPGSDRNAINPSAEGVLAVALLGREDFDVADVDTETLVFGPSGASFIHIQGPHFRDVNGDGFTDLLAHYRVEETGIELGDIESCLTGELLDGQFIRGCDSVSTTPDLDEKTETRLFGITLFGEVLEIDKMSGIAEMIGTAGFVANAAASDSRNRMFTISGDALIQINTRNGKGSVFLEIENRPSGFSVRSMAIDSSDRLFTILHQDVNSPGKPDLSMLAELDLATGLYSIIGPTELTGLQGLAFDANDQLFCFKPGSGLCRVNTQTGQAQIIGGRTGADQALEFDTDGTLFAGRRGLVILDPLSGAVKKFIGVWEYDVRGLAIITDPRINRP